MKSSGEFCALLLIAISLNNVLCFLLSPKCKLHGHRQGRSSVDMASEHSATYKTFLNEIAMTRAPERLDDLLELIELSGDEITGPTAGRVDLNPFLIPLAKSPKDGSLTCYIRWPTQKEDFDLQLVRTTDVGVTLLATGTSQYCHRLAVENQFYSRPFSEKSIEIINRNGLIYKSEDYMSYLKSGKFPAITEDDLRLVLDRYLLTKVGAFPDCYERLAANYFNNGDLVSAFVTCERAVSIFYGWGHPISFHATLMEKADRDKEAKDTARFAFGMPAWTIAKTQQELERLSVLAGFSGTAILGEMHAYRAQDPRLDEVGEGLSETQVVLDQAAHLMDAVAFGNVTGGWDAVRDTLAQKYSAGGYPEMAAFVKA